MKKTIKILGIILLGFLSLWILYNKGLSTGSKHLFHMALELPGRDARIVSDNFHFWEQNYSKEYTLKTFYSDYYELGIEAKSKCLETGWESQVKYKFSGKLKIDFLHQGKIVSSKEIDASQGGSMYPGDMNYYKLVPLEYFEIPFEGKYKNNVSLRLSVISPDETLKKFADDIMLYVKISGRK